ncbi:flagellar biosynthesis protein FlhB [Tropicibacter naphthalenivorans]|uniref:Flagellar biosynthetic protein FlhB n=1 Tax=Tropicibacter naphthalenivorans TaxID=441103 RepID=A0A0P1GDV3_9RHOB|nr:flagellar type III secretion system protein FlhB [Tropicibacter naphthalenivorans]CUH79703.1 Flagellar biosynthetic protein FlhB [Tropicibacter naphthalenivorans]SMC74575.1 flagellar biosynthetic protein FlhB [Tropicibacter naphthalenivorans]
MAEEDEGGEKSHEPSQKKLDDARKKGEIPRAADLNTAMAYLGMLICCTALGSYSLMRFGDALMPLIEQPDRLTELFFGDGAQTIAGSVMTAGMAPAMPLLLVPGLFVIFTLFATRSFVFSGEKLIPKMNRISPISNAKNKFGRRGLFEFFKSFVKLTVYSILLAVFLRSQLNDITGTIRANPTEIMVLLTRLMLRFLSIVVLIAASIGALDYFFQRAEHMRKHRMSHKEMQDEAKEAEGDPYLKAHRRGRAQELAMNQMMADVPEADVIIVNPTHYAVALKWSRAPGSAPSCVAKGVDEIALKIREIADENDVPIHSDPPTARALYATTEIGDEISTDHYRPVAAAIRFADSMRAKARKSRWI